MELEALVPALFHMLITQWLRTNLRSANFTSHGSKQQVDQKLAGAIKWRNQKLPKFLCRIRSWKQKLVLRWFFFHKSRTDNIFNAKFRKLFCSPTIYDCWDQSSNLNSPLSSFRNVTHIFFKNAGEKKRNCVNQLLSCKDEKMAVIQILTWTPFGNSCWWKVHAIFQQPPK